MHSMLEQQRQAEAIRLQPQTQTQCPAVCCALFYFFVNFEKVACLRMRNVGTLRFALIVVPNIITYR
jgi:hypothetical protein